MTSARLQKLKYVAPAVALKVPYECADRPYVGLEHIVPWTGHIQDDPNAEPEGVVSLFEPGDILFGKLRPYLAKVALADFAGASSTEALVLRPGKAAWPPYLRYVLSDKKFIDEVNASTFGAKMPRASWDFIGSRKVPTPDIDTQKAIANFLDRETARIDQLIEKKRRFVETLSANRKIAALHVLDGFGAPSMRPTAETYDTGHAADGWSVLRVKHVVSFITSGSRGWSQFIADDGELFLQSGNIGRNMEVDLATAQRIEPRTGAEAERTRLMSCDVLVLYYWRTYRGRRIPP